MNGFSTRRDLHAIVAKPRHERTIREDQEAETFLKTRTFRHAVLIGVAFAVLILTGVLHG